MAKSLDVGLAYLHAGRRNSAVQAYKMDKISSCAQEEYIMKSMIYENYLLEEITFCNFVFL